MDPSGAVVLVTGASRGIGAATAAAFDRAGAKVAVAARHADSLERIASRLRESLVLVTDLGRAEEVEAMVRRTVEHFGRIDVLINNAATAQVIRSDRVGAAEIDAAMAVNLIAPMVATRAALQQMRRQGGGHVINVGMPSWVTGAPMLAPYAASKAALSSWTRALQAELDDTEIRVTEYLPGNVDSGAHDAADARAHDIDLPGDPRQSRLARWLAPLQSPEDVAAQLVDCVRRPRPLVYSSPAVALGTAVGLFTRLRIHVGSRAARALRARTGASIFSAAAAAPAAAAPAAAAEPPAAVASPAAVDAAADTAAAPSLPPPHAPQPVPASGRPQTAAALARRGAPAGAKKKTTKKRASKAKAKPTARSEETPPAAKPAAGRAAGKKKGSAAKSAKKPAVLSPQATARVRAAAERAAASARGDGVPAPKSTGPDGDDGAAES